MRKRQSNNCGIRNNFGYCDYQAQEIILKHPCLNRDDINEVYTWLDDLSDLRKLSIGIGAVENCIVDDNGDTLYTTARGVIRHSLAQTSEVDNQILKNILFRLKNKKQLHNLALKCYLFAEDNELFDSLLQVIKSAKELIYLDLNGCYFSDEQLLDLGEVIAKTHIAHLGWPEPRLSEMIVDKIADQFRNNRSLVVMHGVPLEFQKIAQDNRLWLYGYARRPAMIGEAEKKLIHEYAASYRLGVAFDKQRLFDLEKTVEAVLA